MEKLPALFAILDRNYSPEFWSEVELHSIAHQLKQLDQHGWEEVMRGWTSLSFQGQINLIEACGASEHPMGMQVLEVMVYSPNADVGAAVANQMLERDYEWNPEISIRAEFQRHRENLDGYKLKFVERMILRLPR
jgi:hypothetical protein